jgi:hypothetical protein
VLRAAAQHQKAGERELASRLRGMADELPQRRRAAGKKTNGRSVRAISGGLPTLGGRR